MSKKRRTKKEKFAALSRHDFVTLASSDNIQQINIKTPEVIKSPKIVLANPYTHIATDIRSTLIITAILISANLAFFTLLKLKIVNLFGIIF